MTTKEEAHESAYGNLRTLTYEDLDKQNIKTLLLWQDKYKTIFSTFMKSFWSLLAVTGLAFWSVPLAVGLMAFWLVYLIEEEKRTTAQDRERIQRIIFYETDALEEKVKELKQE